MNETLVIAGRSCVIRPEERPRFLLIQPADDHDLEMLESESRHLSLLCPAPWILAAFHVSDWNDDLSPWEAPPVFGNQPFRGKAGDTLAWTEQCLLPELFRKYSLAAGTPVILGGYSLAGLFALWSVCQTGRFSAAACASPSLWFPGWIDYAEKHAPLAECIYLSLGNREEKTRNPVMARSGQCIQAQYELLQAGSPSRKSALEWNEGNHFKDPDLRTARAFAWCMNTLSGSIPSGV